MAKKLRMNRRMLGEQDRSWQSVEVYSQNTQPFPNKEQGAESWAGETWGPLIYPPAMGTKGNGHFSMAHQETGRNSSLIRCMIPGKVFGFSEFQCLQLRIGLGVGSILQAQSWSTARCGLVSIK